MAEAPREAWITGIGIVSCLGEGLDAHWQGFAANKPVIDTELFPPFIVHPLAPIDFDKQIPKKGDQRQMEPWQRIGTYAAGLALDSAGAKGNTALLGHMDMIVAAGGGERDEAVDAAIMSELPKAAKPDQFLNDRLMNDLRPTLFLAQLSNLLAGNVSIVHGVTGSSRTFMGEELASIDALQITLARIVSGQSDITLVGGAYNAERSRRGHALASWRPAPKATPAGVGARRPRRGFTLGSLGAFLVVRAAHHAEARGAAIYATRRACAGDRGPRERAGGMTRSPATASREDAGAARAERPSRPTACLRATARCTAREHDRRRAAVSHGSAVRDVPGVRRPSVEAAFPRWCRRSPRWRWRPGRRLPAVRSCRRTGQRQGHRRQAIVDARWPCRGAGIGRADRRGPREERVHDGRFA